MEIHQNAGQLVISGLRKSKLEIRYCNMIANRKELLDENGKVTEEANALLITIGMHDGIE